MNLRIVTWMAALLVMAASIAPADAAEPAKTSQGGAEKDAVQPDESEADAYRSLLEQGAGEQAEGKQAADAPGVPAGDVPTGSVWILFGGAGLIALGGWAYQKYRGGLSPGEVAEMEHVRSMKLGTKHQLTIVEVEGRRLLLGLSDGHMQVLAELDVAPATSAHAHLSEPVAKPQADEDEWKLMLQAAIADSRPATKPQPESKRQPKSHATRQTHDGLFERASRANLESNSVVCGLKSLEQESLKSRGRS